MSNTNTPVNPFKKGNQHYKLATHTGRPKRYATPEDLWKRATTYFEWNMENPIRRQAFRRGKLVTIRKQREMSLKALHAWLGVSNLYYYRRQPEFRETAYRISNVVFEHNFVYAAAGLLKGRSVGHTLRKRKHEEEVDPIPCFANKTSLLASCPLADTRPDKYVRTKDLVILRQSNTRFVTLFNKKEQPATKAETQKKPIDTKKVGILNIPTETKSVRVQNCSENQMKKTPVDTKKVRIVKTSVNTKSIAILRLSKNRTTKQKLFSTMQPLAKNKIGKPSYTHSAMKHGRYTRPKLSGRYKYRVDTKKVRISPSWPGGFNIPQRTPT